MIKAMTCSTEDETGKVYMVRFMGYFLFPACPRTKEGKRDADGLRDAFNRRLERELKKEG